MSVRLLAVLCLLGAAVASVQQEDKNRPVTKVINLLKDMQKQLEKEGEEDEEVYDKVMCWCETNDREKTQAIADGEQRITDLGASIEELTASSARLTAEISALNGELGKNTNALDKATNLRTSDLAAFNAEEKETLGSIASMKAAITVLSSQHSFLQSADNTAVTKVAQMLKETVEKKKVFLAPSHKRAILAFAQDPEGYLGGSFAQYDGFEGKVANAGSYAPQSGAIFGILKNMKESFEHNLASSQQEEMEGVNQFNELKSAKEEEIDAGNAQVSQKSDELAASDEQCATDKQDLIDTTATLKSDRDFLAMLKMHCQQVDAQMEERQKTRALEISAVSKALSILSGDAAHDLFTKTFNPAFFLQKSSTTEAQEKVAKMLASAGKKAKDSKLILLATKVKLDAFSGVGKEINKLIDDLETEKQDEIKFKDWCIEEFADNAHNNALNTKDKERLVAASDHLKNQIDNLNTEIDKLNADVAEMQLQMKNAASDREAENKVFQQTVADQRATQQLLGSALNVLKGFYGLQVQKKTGAKQLAGPPPPPGFKNYENNASSGGVMGMLEGIIAETKEMEAAATRDEASAQKAYEDFVADTNASINDCNTSITNKSEAKAKAESDKTETDVELDSTLAQLQQLSNESADLHSNCDFTLGNFDVRQEARDSEIESLKASLQILSGAGR